MTVARIKAILAEDESPQRAKLGEMLGELWPELDIVAQCADGNEALRAIEQQQPQVAFLDIRMPGLTGIEVARAAGDAVHVVFITAYDAFAVQAFDEGASDYLLKPVDRGRLQAAIARVKRRLEAGAPLDLSALLAKIGAHVPAQAERIVWITASVGTAVRVICVDDVLLFQSQEKYTRVLTATDEAFIRMPLKDLIPRLDANEFWQVNRGAVVRVGAIRIVRAEDDGRLHAHLRDSAEIIPVSGTYAARFRAL